MSKGKILVIDDEELVVLFFQKVLKEAGYEAKIARRGSEAIELAKKEMFEIVFTDLVMAEMSGVEVCRQIKKFAPQTKVVLVSGHPEQISKHLMPFIQAGGRDEILRKPVTEEEILGTCEKIMNGIKGGMKDGKRENTGH